MGSVAAELGFLGDFFEGLAFGSAVEPLEDAEFHHQAGGLEGDGAEDDLLGKALGFLGAVLVLAVAFEGVFGVHNGLADKGVWVSGSL